MSAQLNHRETRALFLALADEELPAEQALQVRSHLDGCGECQRGWQAYAGTLSRVRTVERHKAPERLASNVMLRLKRERRSGLRKLTLAHAHYRLPVEIIIPILLAAAVAAFIFMAS